MNVNNLPERKFTGKFTRNQGLILSDESQCHPFSLSQLELFIGSCQKIDNGRIDKLSVYRHNDPIIPLDDEWGRLTV